jgi:flagellar biosynthetic protein FlhB
MAEETGQEKTEEPTPKRIREAREKGDVPRSKELGATVLLLAAAASALIFGDLVAGRMRGMMASNLSLEREALFDSSMMVAYLARSMQARVVASRDIEKLSMQTLFTDRRRNHE